MASRNAQTVPVEGGAADDDFEASPSSSSSRSLMAAEARRSFQDLIADLGALQAKLLEAHVQELQAYAPSTLLEPTTPASCPPHLEVATDAVDIGSPERLGRLSPIHKFMLARQRGAFAARRLSDERESENVRQALGGRRRSITATDRLALAMRDAAAFEEQVRKEASSYEVDRYQLRSNFDIGDIELVEMKRRSITKQYSDAAEPHLKRTTSSDSDPGGPTPTEVQEERMLNSWSKLFPIHPSSRRRIAWELLAMALLFFDMVATPMMVFDLPDVAFLRVMSVACTLYWMLDIPMSMLTATYRNGNLVTSYWVIFHMYSRTWMPIDVLLVCVDLVATVADVSTADTLTLARAVRTGRILRMLRLARLLRVVKLKRLSEDFKRRLAGEIAVFLVNVTQLFTSTMLLTHVLACVWYWLGSEEEGWVYTEGLHGQDLGSIYIQSMQWSLARLHPISLRDNMKLRLQQERIFSLVASFGSLLFSSMFISYVTNTMAKLAHMWKERSRKLGAISEYAATHRINTALTVRLKKYVEREEERVKWKVRLQVLEAALPPELLRVLYRMARTPTLANHGLFSKLNTSAGRTMGDLCYDAVHEQHFLAGDTIFEVGGVAASMYMCDFGKLCYSMDPEIAGRDPMPNIHLVDRLCCCRLLRRDRVAPIHKKKIREPSVELTWGSWISEHALWTSVWHHTGQLYGTTDSQILVVKSEEFARVVEKDLQTFCDVVIYARYFVHEMNQTEVNTDLAPDQMVHRSASTEAWDAGGGATSVDLQETHIFHDLLPVRSS